MMNPYDPYYYNNLPPEHRDYDEDPETMAKVGCGCLIAAAVMLILLLTLCLIFK